MQDKKDSMVIYRSFLEAVEEMPHEAQLPLLKAIIRYGLDGELPTDLDVYSRPVFKAIQPTIDKAIERYKKSVENGKKGGRPKKEYYDNEQNPYKARTADEILAQINEYKIQ